MHYRRINSLSVEISNEFSPGNQGVSETLPYYFLLPSYFFDTTVVNWYDRSIFNMAVSLGKWATPPVRPALYGRNSGQIPKRPNPQEVIFEEPVERHSWKTIGKTYWEPSENKASREPLRARNKNWICYFYGENDLNSEKGGIYESPPDRYVLPLIYSEKNL